MIVEIKWIPTSEELPKPGHIVLVWCPKIECIYTAALMKYSENTFTWSLTGSAPGEQIHQIVTHWTPLPPPPTP